MRAAVRIFISISWVILQFAPVASWAQVKAVAEDGRTDIEVGFDVTGAEFQTVWQMLERYNSNAIDTPPYFELVLNWGAYAALAERDGDEQTLLATFSYLRAVAEFCETVECRDQIEVETDHIRKMIYADVAGMVGEYLADADLLLEAANILASVQVEESPHHPTPGQVQQNTIRPAVLSGKASVLIGDGRKFYRVLHRLIEDRNSIVDLLEAGEVRFDRNRPQLFFGARTMLTEPHANVVKEYADLQILSLCLFGVIHQPAWRQGIEEVCLSGVELADVTTSDSRYRAQREALLLGMEAERWIGKKNSPRGQTAQDLEQLSGLIDDLSQSAWDLLRLGLVARSHEQEVRADALVTIVRGAIAKEEFCRPLDKARAIAKADLEYC